jgi:hypothetical protein
VDQSTSVIGHPSLLLPQLRHAVFHQVFRNLNRVGSGTFSQVIRHDPHVQGVGLGFVSSEPSYKHLISLVCRQWHRVDVVGRIIL